MFEFTVNAESEGQRLDRFLVAVLADHSRSQIQKLIADGHVRVDAREARPNLAVRAGDRIVVDIPAASAASVEAEATPLEILHQDADIVVVNKPPGMVVHPGAGHASGTSPTSVGSAASSVLESCIGSIAARQG